VDSEHGINTAIRKIRLALEEGSEQPRFVGTVVGKGYRFICPVVARAGQVESSGSQEAGGAKVRPPLSKSARRLWISLASALMLLAAALALNSGGWWDRTVGGTAARIESVGVLPLANLSGDSSQDYFVDGMTDELITNLARLGTFRVISRTSAKQYKSTQKKAPEIARELHVDAVVEGSVSRSGDRLRVRARLIHAATGELLWADTFERGVSDVLALQEDLAQAIAGRIDAPLTPEDRSSRPRPGVLVPDALEAYLKGRLAWHRRNEAGLQEAIDYFRQAIALDPGYASAYSGMADSYATLGYFSYLSPEESFPAAKAAALKALELDATLAEPHASLGYVRLYYDWDWAGAEEEFKQAIALNPNYATAYEWYGVYLTALGRHAEAAVAIERAQELDPLSPAISTDAGFQLYYSRRPDDAIRHLDSVLATYPKLPLARLWLGRTYEDEHRYVEALAEFRQAATMMRDWPVTVAAIGHVLGSMGDKEGARRALDELHDLSRTRYVTAYGVALVYAALDDDEQVFEWLNRAIEERTHWLVWLKVDPRWDRLRSDPRFEDVLRRVGFPE
jgi:TolB-like protein/Flp pilus assembly protein TadD